MPITVTKQITVRYCQDCRWYSNELEHVALATCSHPLLNEKNLVMHGGEGASCIAERGDHGKCGPEGRYYQYKPRMRSTSNPWWRFW